MRRLIALKKGLGFAAAVAVAMIGLLPVSAKALPFQYAPGDILAVFNKAGTDFILNFGGLPASGSITKSYALPSTFGGSLSGATFNGAFRVADQNAFPESIEFTTDSALDFPDPDGLLPLGLSNAQPSFHQWASLLPNVPAPPAGGNVTAREVDLLAISATAGFSYTSQLGLGTDAINTSLPFGVTTRGVLDAPTNFYTVTYDFDTEGNSVYSKTLRGSFLAVQNGSNLDLTFNVVPEPGTLLLLTSGLVGLGISGRKARA